jgi:hypothetical protein
VFRPILAGLLLLVLIAAAAPAASPLQAETLVFQTDMYGTENVPAVTTVAYGFVRFFFNDARTAADYTVDVKGYNGTQVTGADIHRGVKGVNGPVVKHLADGGFIVTGGRATFTEQELREMAAGLWYVSLKTADHPEGALRGQIAPPSGFLAGSTAPQPPPSSPLPPVPEMPAPAAGPAAEPAPAGLPPVAPSLPPVNDAAPPQSFFRPPNTGDGGLLP